MIKYFMQGICKEGVDVDKRLKRLKRSMLGTIEGDRNGRDYDPKRTNRSIRGRHKTETNFRPAM
jgi:hypothetical protein